MKGGILTKTLLEKLFWVAEHRLRYAVRSGKLKPRSLDNGMYVWPETEVKKALRLFIDTGD